MAEPVKCRLEDGHPEADYFKPRGKPLRELQEVVLPLEGLTALRLTDLKGLTPDEAALKMNIPRQTFDRILVEARRVVSEALVEGHALRIEGDESEPDDRAEETTGAEGASSAQPDD